VRQEPRSRCISCIAWSWEADQGQKVHLRILFEQLQPSGMHRAPYLFLPLELLRGKKHVEAGRRAGNSLFLTPAQHTQDLNHSLNSNFILQTLAADLKAGAVCVKENRKPGAGLTCASGSCLLNWLDCGGLKDAGVQVATLHTGAGWNGARKR